ncbi:MAG TPA: ubiquitin-like small modifier protein 1 [Kineosporiaceae bacterium]
MSSVELHLPGLLADDAGGQAVHRVDPAAAATVGDLLDAVGSRWPRLGRRLRDETGQLRPYVNVYVGAEDVRWTQGLATAVRPGDVVLVLPSVAGG